MQPHKMRCPSHGTFVPTSLVPWYGMEPIPGLQSRRIPVPIHMVQPAATDPVDQS